MPITIGSHLQVSLQSKRPARPMLFSLNGTAHLIASKQALARMLQIFLVISAALSQLNDNGPFATTQTTEFVGGFTSNPSTDQSANFFYPTTRNQKFPMLVFGHGATAGGGLLNPSYSNLVEAVASFGYVICAPRSCVTAYCQDFDEDLLRCFEFMKNDRELSARIDFTLPAGVFGHSMVNPSLTYIRVLTQRSKLLPLSLPQSITSRRLSRFTPAVLVQVLQARKFQFRLFSRPAVETSSWHLVVAKASMIVLQFVRKASFNFPMPDIPSQQTLADVDGMELQLRGSNVTSRKLLLRAML